MARYRVAIYADSKFDGYVQASNDAGRIYEASILTNAQAMCESLQKRFDESLDYLTSKNLFRGPVFEYKVEEQ